MLPPTDLYETIKQRIKIDHLGSIQNEEQELYHNTYEIDPKNLFIKWFKKGQSADPIKGNEINYGVKYENFDFDNEEITIIFITRHGKKIKKSQKEFETDLKELAKGKILIKLAPDDENKDSDYKETYLTKYITDKKKGK